LAFMFIVSGSTSIKTILAPLKANAFAVLEKVKLGMMISSPSLMSNKIAANSSAAVQEGVKRALTHGRLFSNQL